MIFISLFCVALFWWKSEITKIKYKSVVHKSPLHFMPAFKFGLIFLSVLFLVEFSKQFLGESGYYITALISGFADVDAITISMSQESFQNPALNDVASRTITLAVLANTTMKGGIAMLLGGKMFAKYVGICVAAVVLGGVVGIFMI